MTHRGALIQAACLAAELNLADHLKTGPLQTEELARLSGSHPPSLARLLRALVSLGLCTENSAGAFALTAMGELLRSDTPDFAARLDAVVRWLCRPVWGHLRHSIKTGESARGLATGVEGFSSFARNPQAAALFNGAMDELTRLIAREVLRVYDFTHIRRIIDVGGGQGALLAALLAAHTHLNGAIYDMQHAADGAAATLAAAHLGARGEFLTGSFFESVPEGADTYILKNVLHDWPDDKCAVILDNCRAAIPTGGKLLLIERVMPAHINASPRHQAFAYADLTMLIGPGGRERTEAEFRALLDAAGFSVTRVVETALVFSVIEAVVKR